MSAAHHLSLSWIGCPWPPPGSHHVPCRRGFAGGIRPGHRTTEAPRAPALVSGPACAGELRGAGEARSFTAIAEWVADAGETVWSALGITRVPDASPFRRVFAALDADALNTASGAWATAATKPSTGTRRVAVDGKTPRGSRAGDSPGRHLLAALDHHTGVVLGQVAVDARSNEIPALPVLLADLDLTSVVLTADALHTQTETARRLGRPRGALRPE